MPAQTSNTGKATAGETGVKYISSVVSDQISEKDENTRSVEQLETAAAQANKTGNVTTSETDVEDLCSAATDQATAGETTIQDLSSTASDKTARPMQDAQVAGKPKNGKARIKPKTPASKIDAKKTSGTAKTAATKSTRKRKLSDQSDEIPNTSMSSASLTVPDDKKSDDEDADEPTKNGKKRKTSPKTGKGKAAGTTRTSPKGAATKKTSTAVVDKPAKDGKKATSNGRKPVVPSKTSPKSDGKKRTSDAIDGKVTTESKRRKVSIESSTSQGSLQTQSSANGIATEGAYPKFNGGTYVGKKSAKKGKTSARDPPTPREKKTPPPSNKTDPWAGMTVEEALAVPMNGHLSRTRYHRPHADRYDSVLGRLPSERETNSAAKFIKERGVDTELSLQCREEVQAAMMRHDREIKEILVSIAYRWDRWLPLLTVTIEEHLQGRGGGGRRGRGAAEAV